MRKNGNTIPKAILILGVCLAAVGVRAQVRQTVLFSAVQLKQGEKAPAKLTLTTESLLKDLALDETTNGTWFNSEGKVPANARLVGTFAPEPQTSSGPPSLGGIQGFSLDPPMPPPSFETIAPGVLSGTNMISVANVLTISMGGSNDLDFAKFPKVNTNYPPFFATNYHVCTITYDATASGGKQHFTVSGLATSWSTANHPDASGYYIEQDGFRLTGGVGEGVDRDGIPFLLTGATITASGSSTRICDHYMTGQNPGGGTIGIIMTGPNPPPPTLLTAPAP